MFNSGAGQDGDWRAGGIEFRRGWIASTDPSAHDITDSWPMVRIGPLTVRVHPALGWSTAQHGDRTVLLLGDPADLDAGTTHRGRIARTITRRRYDLLRHVAYLGGRFNALLWEHDRLTVIPDCVASVPTFWHHVNGTLTLGSHAPLVGEVTGSEPNVATINLLRRAKQMSTPGTIYWPGAETPFVGVQPLLPNHTLAFDGQVVEHARFYPFPETVLPRDPEVAYGQFRDLFATHVKLLCGLGRTGISLTGGMDSRATFKAALPHLGRDALTWTYYKFGAPDPAMQADLMAANALAREARVPHQVIAVETPKDGPFADAYERTMRHTRQFRALAGAYHHQLPGDLVELQSMVAEVGTGFFKNRTDGPPTVERIARLYSNSDFGRLPEISSALEAFVSYANFHSDSFGPVPWYDLFYWEARVGRWGALRMQEVDLSHHLMLPFNARGIVEALLGPALESRAEKQALARYIASP